MGVKVSSKYQVVIPESVRALVDLKPGHEVEVLVKGGILYLVPVLPLKELQKKSKIVLAQADLKTLREKKDRTVGS